MEIIGSHTNEVEKSCTKVENEEVCRDILHKKGNASIERSPVDLKPFIDKPVRVTGSFRMIVHSIKEDKQFCIQKNMFQKECVESTGPGFWYTSPLSLKTIQLDKP